jgi:hypothetical protein
MRTPAPSGAANDAPPFADLDPRAEFWTLEHRDGARRRRLRRDTADSFRRIALAVHTVLADLDEGHDHDDALLEAGLFRLSGTRLTDVQRHAFIHDDAHLDRRIAELIDAHGLRDLSPARDRRAGRALILHAAEFGFVAVAGGALEAMRTQPRSPRIDLRTVAHVTTRWAARWDPLLARLAVSALSFGAAVRPWRPLTLFVDAAMGLHLGRERMRVTSAELSGLIIQELRRGYDANAGSAAVTERILAHAEAERIIEPRTGATQRPSDSRLPWTKLLLELEVGSELPPEASLLAELFDRRDGVGGQETDAANS